MRRRSGGLGVAAAIGGLALGLVIAGLHGGSAQAQPADSSSGQIQNQPLPPPPGTNETNVLGPDTSGSAVSNPPAPPAPEAPSSAAPPPIAAPSEWIPQQQAQLTVLDKIYGSATTVSAKVGVPFAVRFLTVTVLACWVRRIPRSSCR
jgi:hypothetical protein